MACRSESSEHEVDSGTGPAWLAAGAGTALIDVLGTRHRPIGAHVKQVHEVVVGEGAGSLGEHPVTSAAPTPTDRPVAHEPAGPCVACGSVYARTWVTADGRARLCPPCATLHGIGCP